MEDETGVEGRVLLGSVEQLPGGPGRAPYAEHSYRLSPDQRHRG